MEKIKFAELDQEQVKQLNQLENQLGVTLLAYDSSSINETKAMENESSIDSASI